MPTQAEFQKSYEASGSNSKGINSKYIVVCYDLEKEQLSGARFYLGKIIDYLNQIKETGLFHALHGEIACRHDPQAMIIMGEEGQLNSYYGLKNNLELSKENYKIAVDSKGTHTLDELENHYQAENNNELLQYNQFIEKNIGHQKSDIESPWRYSSTSSAIEIPQSKKKALNSQGSDYQYFSSQIEAGKGHGLLSIAPVEISNLNQMDLPRKYKIADNENNFFRLVDENVKILY